jgi:hypothetical protein
LAEVDKLQSEADAGHLRRVATEPGKVRDMIELAISHSNASVERARLKGKHKEIKQKKSLQKKKIE